MKPSLLIPLSLLGLAYAFSNSYNGPHADACPGLCVDAGPNLANWTHIHDLHNLKTCNLTVLFDLNVQASVADPGTIITIRACVATKDQILKATTSPIVPQQLNQSQNSLVVSNNCGAKAVKATFTPYVGGSMPSTGAPGTAPQSGDMAEAAHQLSQFVSENSECGTTILFAKSRSAVVGLYSGAQITKSSARVFLESFVGRNATAQQICRPADAAMTVGVVATNFHDLAMAQAVVKGWNGGLCLDGSVPAPSVDVDVLVSVVDKGVVAVPSNATSNATAILHSKMRRWTARPRGTCTTQEVLAGDSCASLASRCGISSDDLLQYNQEENLCSILKPKQHVCCDEGFLPDPRPQPQSNGTCNTYLIGQGDGCLDLADMHYLEQQDLEDFNNNTWGWAGCGNLQVGQVICLSKGTPPMPAPVQGAVCGPQVPGTTQPTDMTTIADLNPCPLNACCDVWGFCGTTALFCTQTPADTGAPGTAKPGTNGCISNCGVDIVNNDQAPDAFRSIAYFEAFDQQRECLTMDVSEIPQNKYTHIHFAFATVTTEFDVDVSDSQDQFDKFESMSGFKKILSFGGWAFSTDPGTFQRFRDATKEGNRVAFVGHLLGFMNSHDLDGFDFDWEYPGAPDIPDIPPGSPDDGNNYAAFLQLLRSQLPSGKSISIALPASYWYLKAYPLKDIAQSVDYFIYMTYDLHGQWDVGNPWAIPGCEDGNCLRSHINKTEVYGAMAMATKAGVEARQLVIGISSYGRSFRMTDASCSGPLCTYEGTGNQSMAYPGHCTGAAGYISNAEINEIITLNPDNYTIVQSSVDEDSDSNILMFGNAGAVDWVAYMDGDLKANRVDWIKGLNFGGSSDWAIDLEDFSSSEASHDDGVDDDGVGDDDESFAEDPDNCVASDNPGTLQGLLDNINSLNPACVKFYALDILYSQLLDSLALFDTTSDGYDDMFKYYAQWTKDQIQPRIDDFMTLGSGEGLKYFDCEYSYTGHAEAKDSCLGMPHIWEQNFQAWSIRFDLVDEQGFFDALEAATGIDKSWVVFSDVFENRGCQDASDLPQRPGGGSRPCAKITENKYNYPQKGPDDSIQVGNPKDVIQAAMPNVTALHDSLLASYMSVGFTFYEDVPSYNVSATDAVVAYSMPIFQLAEAVDSMKQVKDIGEKAKEEEKKNLIFEILSIVFMVVPFVGESLGPALGGSLSILARVASLIGEAGNGALALMDLVEDPLSAPFVILGLIANGGANVVGELEKADTLKSAARTRESMGTSQLAKFSKKFQVKDQIIEAIKDKLCG